MQRAVSLRSHTPILPSPNESIRPRQGFEEPDEPGELEDPGELEEPDEPELLDPAGDSDPPVASELLTP